MLEDFAYNYQRAHAMNVLLRSVLLVIFVGFGSYASAKPRLEEIRTASDRVLVLVFRGGARGSCRLYAMDQHKN